MIIILLITCLSAVNSNENQMSTVAVPVYTFDPQITVDSLYHSHSHSGSLISATFKWYATIPTVNLDNFEQISLIDCSADVITLSFDTTANAQKAMESWSNSPDIALLIGHEHKCKGIETVKLLSILKIEYHQSKFLLLETKELRIEDVLTDYDLDIETAAEPDIRKRAINLNPFHLDINFDRATNKPKRDAITAFPIIASVGDKSVKVGITLKNSYLKGDLGFGLRTSIRNKVVPRYEASIVGQLKVNMDVNMNFDFSSNKIVPETSMGEVKLPPIYVPGLFNFGPLLRFDTIFDFKIPKKVDIDFGIDFEYDFRWDARSDRLFGRPKTTFNDYLTANPHKFSTSLEKVGVRVNTKFMPQLGTVLNVFGHRVIGSALNVHKVFGIRNVPATIPSCLGGSSTELYEQRDLTYTINLLGVSTTNVGLKHTEDHPIDCVQCNQCILNKFV